MPLSVILVEVLVMLVLRNDLPSLVSEFLIGRSECTKQERIDALELLGATYVDKKRDMLGAINFWRQAMEDRSSEPALPKPRQGSQIAAY
jgi:hypothetical protein